MDRPIIQRLCQLNSEREREREREEEVVEQTKGKSRHGTVRVIWTRAVIVHASQCAQFARPIIFMASFKRSSFSYTMLGPQNA